MNAVSTRQVTATSVNALVCVDSHDSGVLGGVMYSRFLSEPFVFRDVVQLTEQMDGIYDTYSFPQAFFAKRTFGGGRSDGRVFQKEEIRHMPQEAMPVAQGAKGTFLISVQFRQNATWQGTITWVDRRKKQYFRSALEMLKLMNEALAGESDAEEKIGWE